MSGVYLKNFLCETDDFTLLLQLTVRDRCFPRDDARCYAGWTQTRPPAACRKQAELERAPVTAHSQHLKFENPSFSATFTSVVNRMAEFFDVNVLATRLNFYRDGTDWKPFHRDSHAYTGDGREDFTMGASFGSERELAFLHEPSGCQFSFPQRNGDVFAFDTEVNQKFMHGVPRSQRGAGPRFSIIAWGRRRSLNTRNGGHAPPPPPRAIAAVDSAPHRPRAVAAAPSSGAPGARQNELVMDGAAVVDIVQSMVAAAGSKSLLLHSDDDGSAAPTATQSVLAKRLRSRIGEASYALLKERARAWQHGDCSTDAFLCAALELAGLEASADLLELARFLPEGTPLCRKGAARELAHAHAAFVALLLVP